jgi:hypothetical protein
MRLARCESRYIPSRIDWTEISLESRVRCRQSFWERNKAARTHTSYLAMATSPAAPPPPPPLDTVVASSAVATSNNHSGGGVGCTAAATIPASAASVSRSNGGTTAVATELLRIQQRKVLQALRVLPQKKQQWYTMYLAIGAIVLASFWISNFHHMNQITAQQQAAQAASSRQDYVHSFTTAADRSVPLPPPLQKSSSSLQRQQRNEAVVVVATTDKAGSTDASGQTAATTSAPPAPPPPLQFHIVFSTGCNAFQDCTLLDIYIGVCVCLVE